MSVTVKKKSGRKRKPKPEKEVRKFKKKRGLKKGDTVEWESIE